MKEEYVQIELDIDDEFYERIKKFMDDKGIDSFNDAFCKLLEIGIKHKEKMEKMN